MLKHKLKLNNVKSCEWKSTETFDVAPNKSINDQIERTTNKLYELVKRFCVSNFPYKYLSIKKTYYLSDIDNEVV